MHFFFFSFHFFPLGPPPQKKIASSLKSRMVGESRRRDLVPVALVLSKIITNEKKTWPGKKLINF